MLLGKQSHALRERYSLMLGELTLMRKSEKGSNYTKWQYIIGKGPLKSSLIFGEIIHRTKLKNIWLSNGSTESEPKLIFTQKVYSIWDFVTLAEFENIIANL